MLDDAEVEEYLTRHRKGARQIYAAQMIQSTWRMYLRRRKYLSWRRRRLQYRRAFFELWVMTYRVGTRAHRSLMRKYFKMWYGDVVETMQLREMELQLFRQAATQKQLPRMVLNLVFTSDWERDGGKQEKDAKAIASESKAASKTTFLGAFLGAAFAGVEAPSDKGRSRVFQLRAQHVAAREEVRKKVVQHVFLIWKKLHEAKKRVGINAQLCLKRAVRMAFGSRQRWPAETLLLVFEIWARWAAFNRCKRLGLPLPHYAQSNPHWDIWQHNYQERQVRCVKAAAKAPAARLRRFYLRLHAHARRQIRRRQVLAIASLHYSHVISRKILLEWRQEIAESAHEKKVTRDILLRFHRYARAKKKLRPLKLFLRKQHHESFYRRAWRAWQRVQLHAAFKRELNLSRLENSQTWRLRLQHTLAVWRDERENLVLWRTFEAWTHFIRKRKLFLTMKLLCARQQRRNLLFSVFTAWKSAPWDRIDGFLEDQLRLDAWDAYREVSAFFPMLFYGSFSDAGSIFGGLPSHAYGANVNISENALPRQYDVQEFQLSTAGDAIRHFHEVLSSDSVVDIRNAILQERHLVNAVDDATGNTALHVAAQIEDPARRLEILSLLLSEGAATVKRANRHGLTPLQLAPDPDTNLLLGEGLFAFNSRNTLDQQSMAKTLEDDHRLLWCVITLMAREWSVGDRIPADVHSGQWHSRLREELWLRQKLIRFAPGSTFGPAVTRSRGFLNAVKTRICKSKDEFLYVPKYVVSSKDADEARRRRYNEWEERARDRSIRASATGEYENYARYILATTLDTEACEEWLIPSFVGLLYSLDFSVDEVLSQAYRLEDECTKAESYLWELYQRIRKAEGAWSQLLSPVLKVGEQEIRSDVGMLRLLSSDTDADLFFNKEVFMLEVEKLKHADGAGSSEDGDKNWHLLMELEGLVTKMQRKLRKAEKKVKRMQEQVDMGEKACRTALFAEVRSVEGICTARMALEHSRLRMALSLMKQIEIRAVARRFEDIKLELKGEDAIATSDRRSSSEEMLAAYKDRKSFLEAELSRCSRLFQSRVLLEEAHKAAKRNENAASPSEAKVDDLPEPLYQLQKEATDKVHWLFVLNLFRSCCCWLAENLIAQENADGEANSDSDSESGLSSRGDPVLTKRRSIGMERLLTAAALLAEGIPRRRSSLKNTRRVLETYHRGCTMTNLLDSDSDNMAAKYTASGDLLFEEERRVALEAEREDAAKKKVETKSIMLERNPVTGEAELSPDHIVDFKAIPEARRKAIAIAKPTVVARNRKKEELQRAMKHRQSQRVEIDTEESVNGGELESRRSDNLSQIHGSELNFGNFVIGSGVRSEKVDDNSFRSPQPIREPETALSVSNAEAIWKRGGVKLADGSAPSIKEVLAHAHRMSIAREKKRQASRRQGVASQESSKLMQSLHEAQESVALESKQGEGNSPNDPEAPEKSVKSSSSGGTARVFGSTASASSDFNCTIVEKAAEPEVRLVANISNNPNNNQLEDHLDSQELSEQIGIPASANTPRSWQNPANSTQTSPKYASVEHQRCEIDQIEEKVDAIETQESPDDYTETSKLEDPIDFAPEHDVQMEDAPPLSIEVNLSSPSLPPTQRQIHESSTREFDSQPQQRIEATTDTVDSAMTAFVKWEEGATFEAFPLAVVASNHSHSTFVGDRGSYLDREKPVVIPRVSSFHSDSAQETFAPNCHEDRDKPIHYDNGWPALEGKSMTMIKKTRRLRRTASGTRSQEDTRKVVEKPREASPIDIPDPSSLLSPPMTPSIKITVVTKPAKREVEDNKAKEYVEPTPAPLSPQPIGIDKTPSTTPKPWIKLQPSLDAGELKTHSASQVELQLAGLGLSSSSKALSATSSAQRLGTQLSEFKTREVVSINTDEVKFTGSEQRASPSKTDTSTGPARLAGRKGRSCDAAGPSPEAAFQLQGARMEVPKSGKTENVQRQRERSGFEGMVPLSTEAKQRLWQEFASTPLSNTLQEAYAILYPQSYQTLEVQEGRDARTAPVRKKDPIRISVAASPLRTSTLRADTTQLKQQEMETGRRFWSAVEGYRAIGSSKLVPLDAATITQRRRDKAQVIVDQFLIGRPHNGDSRGFPLPWLDMHPKEVAEVHRQLADAPRELFDDLQRSAELHLVKHHADKSN